MPPTRAVEAPSFISASAGVLVTTCSSSTPSSGSRKPWSCALRAPKRDVGPRGPFSNLLFAPVPLYHNIQPPKEEELGIEVLGVLEEGEVSRR